jgi:hypothetical protein
MAVVNLLQRQVERRADLVCQSRNSGLPVGIGKSDFEPINNGVEFIRYHYKLDSGHIDYSTVVARVLWDESHMRWSLLIPNSSGEWVPYPYLSMSEDLTAVIREVEKDPKSLFWF